MSAPPNAEIARRLPDVPRWVEARGLLLEGPCEVIGFTEAPELSLVVRDPEGELVAVVGTPAPDAVREAVGRNARGGELIAPPDRGDWLAGVLPEWARTRAILHALPDADRLPPSEPDAPVAFVHPEALGRLDLPDDLRRELESGARGSPLAATFVDGRPVAFCYAGSITESFWDVSIDTLAAHRRRGHAARCAAFMIRHMLARGKRPVWGAVEENPASWRLALKLGFEPVDELVLFEQPR